MYLKIHLIYNFICFLPVNFMNLTPYRNMVFGVQQFVFKGNSHSCLAPELAIFIFEVKIMHLLQIFYLTTNLCFLWKLIINKL